LLQPEPEAKFETCDITVDSFGELSYQRGVRHHTMTHAPNDPDFWHEGCGYVNSYTNYVSKCLIDMNSPPKAVRFKRKA